MLRVFLAAALTASVAGPAFAAGEVQLTDGAAIAGSVTPGDAPGYPVTISLPGAYQFAGNLLPPSAANGIEVTSPNVTIDLNGFQLNGGGAAGTGILGIVNNVTIRNGMIAEFQDSGIGMGANLWTVEKMMIIENGKFGIWVHDFARIIDNTVVANGDAGIVCHSGCLIEGNTVERNATGIFVREDSTILGNLITANTGYGIGVITTGGGHLTGYGDNTIVSNNLGGVQVVNATRMLPNACTPGCP